MLHTAFPNSSFQTMSSDSLLPVMAFAISTISPGHEWLGERAVQLVKSGLRRNTQGDMDQRLARILFRYRNTPHVTTGVTPAELLLGRKLRTRLDYLHPDLATWVEKKQETQKANRDNRKPERVFEVGDPVLVQNTHCATLAYSRGAATSAAVIFNHMSSTSMYNETC